MENRVLTLEEAKAAEFMVYEEKDSKRFYPALSVGDQICVADEWDTWSGADAGLYGTMYRFWAHYPSPAELLANPWP